MLRSLAALVAMLICTSAFAQNTHRERWWFFGTSPFAPAQGNSYHVGFGTCQEAADAAYALVQANATNPTLYEFNTCAPSDARSRLSWWENLPGIGGGWYPREVHLHAYCSQLSTQNPMLGPCQPDKNKGECGDCPEGNPIYSATGSKGQKELDYIGPGPFPLRFERSYFSARIGVDTSAGLAAQWFHNYHRKLTFGQNPTAPLSVAATRPDGRIIAFCAVAACNVTGSIWFADLDIKERLEQLPAGWRITNADDEVETYDQLGRLLTITNRAGLTQTLSYVSGLLRSVTDPFGRTLAFEYDTKSRISAFVDPSGGRYEYTYGASTGGSSTQVLSSVRYPDTRTRTYHYEQGGTSLTGITDELGQRFSTYTYDANGLATSSEHAGGAGRVTLSYPNSPTVPPVSVTTYVSATSSATRTYGFQQVQGVVRRASTTGAACPSCGPASQGYDTNGNVAFRTDWNGNRTNFSWDLTRNLETTRIEGLTSAGASAPQTRTISTQWHSTFRLPTVIAEPLRITTNAYDTTGNLLSRSMQPTTDANGSQGFSGAPAGSPRVWTYTYNANGQLLTVDGPRADVSDVTTYTYYANNASCSTANGGHVFGCRGQLQSVANALNQTTTVTEYNAHGQPLRMVDANGLVTAMTYDLRQRLTSRTVGAQTTTYTYDDAGQLTRVTLPDASFLAYSYDAAHRLTGLEDNLGNRIVYTLDLAGNRTQEQVFDPANALAQTRSRVYSNLNRLFQELGAQSQTTEYTYDNQGNVLTVRDPLNRTTTNQYDALNRLRQVTDPGTGVTQYSYNGLDALTQVTDPRNLATSYTVNGLGDLTQQLSPDTGTTGSTYDAAGNLLTQTDAKGQVTTYTYDALNRVTLIVHHDSSRQTYAYDSGANGIGRLASIEERNAANAVTSLIQFAYDAHGRAISETRTPGGVVAYQYDASGRMSGMTYPSGRSLTYGFDAAGRVNQVTTTKDAQSQVVVQNVAYHPFGGVKSYTLGNGQVYARTVDLDGRIASYTLGGSNVAIGFDAASRITSIGANTYGYDTLDRLSSAILPASNFGYSYDAVGNRLTKTVGANTDTYTYSLTSNRIATLTPASGPARTFVLDANGSTTDDGLNTYAYDVKGRMVQATSTAGASAYQVNALGQRVRKTFGPTDTVFVYDRGGRLIAESDPGGTPRREYIYLGDIPVGVVQ